MKINVPKMTCGHCAQTVERAVLSADPDAKLEVDVPNRLVSLTTSAEDVQILDALRAAGYPAEKLDA